MTLTLNLAPDVEAALESDARREGRTREEMAAEALRLYYLSPPLRSGVPMQKSGATLGDAFDHLFNLRREAAERASETPVTERLPEKLAHAIQARKPAGWDRFVQRWQAFWGDP